MFPRYTYPASAIFGLTRDALLIRHRSFASDARACVRLLQPPLRLLGTHHIPGRGPCVVTPNHYYRPGYAAQWTALAISATVPAEVHWVMTGELTFPGRWYASIAIPLYRFGLGRIARAYDFTTMPPMPPRQSDERARASAVLSVLHFARSTGEPVVGLAPEGGDQPGGRLSMPPSGVGRFCLLLAAAGLRFIPVGVYECDGALTLNFGDPYDLTAPQGLGSQDKDRLAASSVVQHIAPLLPADLRGAFG